MRPGAALRALSAGALALAAVGLAAPIARAEIYRCPGREGQPVFTSDPASCPGARRHAPSRRVQRVEGGATARPRAGPAALAPSAGRPAEDPEDAQAAMWRRKRVEAESELAGLERQVGQWKELVSWCNRGGEVVVEDQVGVRDRYSCDDARAQYERIDERIDELRGYLDGGLEDECRRAGCLPGWVR